MRLATEPDRTVAVRLLLQLGGFHVDYRVPLQLRPFDAAFDTELNGTGVLSGNHHVVLVFLPIQHVAAFNTKEIRQEARITRSDSSVLGGAY